LPLLKFQPSYKQDNLSFQSVLSKKTNKRGAQFKKSSGVTRSGLTVCGDMKIPLAHWFRSSNGLVRSLVAKPTTLSLSKGNKVNQWK